MKLIVIDSSVTVKWINQINEKFLDQADKLLKDAQSGSISLLAPELSKYEIGNALLKKGLEFSLASESFATIYQLPITFIQESEKLAKETYKLAQQVGVTYYDASFIALAKQEHATLITDNPKHQKKTTEVKVESLADY